MRASRSAVTAVETLVSAVIGFMILGIAIGFGVAVRRAARAGDIAGFLQDATIALNTVRCDLEQSVQKPSVDLPTRVVVTPDSLRFIRGRFESDGSIDGEVVEYRVVSSRPRLFLLKRTAGSKSDFLPGFYSAIRFDRPGGPGSSYLRITFQGRHPTTSRSDPTTVPVQEVLSSLVDVAGCGLPDYELRPPGIVARLARLPMDERASPAAQTGQSSSSCGGEP